MPLDKMDAPRASLERGVELKTAAQSERDIGVAAWTAWW